MFNREPMHLDLHDSKTKELPTIGYVTYTYDDGTTYNINIKPDIDVYNISNTIGACIWSDEVEYVLTVIPESGSLYYYTDDNSTNQVIVADNTIRLMNSNTNEVIFKKDCLPTIVLESGNIRKLNGSWQNNVIWAVRYNVDENDNPEYVLKACGITKDETSTIVDNGYIVLIPTTNATLKYSSDNKWQTPMFIISGYKFDWRNINISKFSSEQLDTFYNMGTDSFIIEINEGSMLFNNPKDKTDVKVGTQIDFKYVFNTQYYENQVSISYKYTANREYITSLKTNLKDRYDHYLMQFNNTVSNHIHINYNTIKKYVKSNNLYVKSIIDDKDNSLDNLDDFICYKDESTEIDNL
jgi:hypothetical protein